MSWRVMSLSEFSWRRRESAKRISRSWEFISWLRSLRRSRKWRTRTPKSGGKRKRRGGENPRPRARENTRKRGRDRRPRAGERARQSQGNDGKVGDEKKYVFVVDLEKAIPLLLYSIL